MEGRCGTAMAGLQASDRLSSRLTRQERCKNTTGQLHRSFYHSHLRCIPRASGGSAERFVGMGDKCSALCFSVTLFGFVFVSAYGPCVDPPSPPPKAGRTPAQILRRPTPDIFQQLAMSLNPTEKCEMLLETELSIFQTPTHSPPSSSEDKLQLHCLCFLDLYRPKSICQIPHGPALHCGFLRLPSS